MEGVYSILSSDSNIFHPVPERFFFVTKHYVEQTGLDKQNFSA